MKIKLLLASAAFALGLFACAPGAHSVSTAPEPPAAEKASPCPKPQPNPLADLFALIVREAPLATIDPKGPLYLEVGEAERFCEAGAAVACTGGDPAAKGKRLTLSEVVRIDATLRSRFYYTDDPVMYRRNDFWDNDTVCGDCEDYALTLSEMLNKAGHGGDRMALMLWYPNRVGGHATLLVETANAGIVEIGVNPGETPRVYNPRTPLRLGMMRMDGAKTMELFDGVDMWRMGPYLFLGEAAAKPKDVPSMVEKPVDAAPTTP